jgi:hypothetical protein
MAQAAAQPMEIKPGMSFTFEQVQQLMMGMVQEMKKPYVDPDAEARRKREKQQGLEAQRRRELEKKALQEHCTHKDRHGRWLIATVHNHPDQQTRGFCPKCRILIEPEHTEIGYDQKPYRVPAHKLYGIVRELEIENLQPAF